MGKIQRFGGQEIPPGLTRNLRRMGIFQRGQDILEHQGYSRGIQIFQRDGDNPEGLGYLRGMGIFQRIRDNPEEQGYSRGIGIFQWGQDIPEGSGYSIGAGIFQRDWVIPEDQGYSRGRPNLTLPSPEFSPIPVPAPPPQTPNSPCTAGIRGFPTLCSHLGRSPLPQGRFMGFMGFMGCHSRGLQPALHFSSIKSPGC